jgi:lysophospholipase L1-like esterase
MMRSCGIALAILLLSACGSKAAPAGEPTGKPLSAISQATPASPVASTEESGRANDGATVVVAEGDSISVDYGGYYTGHFRKMHPGIQYHVLAKSGSSVVSMSTRLDQARALNPDIVTIFIGANDLGGATSAKAFFDKLMLYVAPLRASGAKVLVATNLPRAASGNAAWNRNHNLLREPVAALLKGAVGKQIDGVIDFGGDPVMGNLESAFNLQLYKDGLHPTDRNWKDARGGHDYLYDIYAEALAPVLARIER